MKINIKCYNKEVVIRVTDFRLIKGLGPKTIEYLNKLNIFDLNDLIHYYPFRFNILKRSDLDNLPSDNKITIDGIIDSTPRLFRFKGYMNKMSFRLNVNKMMVNIVIFNRAFIYKNLVPGKTITVIGKYDSKTNTITASDIYFKPLSDEVIIEPVYNTTAGLNRRNLSKYIKDALMVVKEDIDLIPTYLKLENHFLSKIDSLKIIHNPTDIDILKKAMLRLKYEELFIFMLKITCLKTMDKEHIKGLSKLIDDSKINAFIKQLPFELTTDQVKAVNEIISDLRSDRRMNRLLQGDVGSGKTIVSVIAIYANYLSGYQSALMVPTEILAKQHYHNINKMLEPIGVKVKILTSSLSKMEKKEIYNYLKAGTVNLIIGTHAIIQEDVNFNNLGLVITDEQHRFGVRERNSLRNKGEMPDVLYMSATPIPRTYALTIYGDMDISSIKTVPKGRKEIITTLVKPSDITNVLHKIKDELDNGHQVYVVAPLTKESDKIDLTDVNDLKHKFELAFKSKYKVDIIHGKMKTINKDKVMSDFLDKKINILISTTVIEVGVDVKNATMMVIFDADRFGLSTLHQLRGRVGRNDMQSYCILISEKERERLKVLTETNDGFEVSEADFKLRGQGDLFGNKQSGDMNFKIADLKQDFKILLKAKEDATNFINHNMLDKYPHIKEELRKSINLD